MAKETTPNFDFLHLTALYIAWRYLFAKGKASSVSLMTNLTLLSISVGTAAMILVLSVFSGFVKISEDYYSSVNPEIKITSKVGKVLKNIDSLENFLLKTKKTTAISRTIEEKIYLSYQNNQDLAYLKAVDKNYNKIYPLDSQIFYGNYLSFSQQEIIISDTLAKRLDVVLNDVYPIELMSPKPGKGTFSSNDLRNEFANVSGFFYIPDEKYGQYVFCNIQIAEKLFGLEKGSAYALEIKLKQSVDVLDFKDDLQNALGKNYLIQSRQDQDAAFLKMLNLENSVVYAIVSLVVLVLSFSLIGLLYVLILDKKQSSFTLWSMGFDINSIKKIFFYTGFVLVFFASVIGIFMGSVVAFVQLKTEFFAPGGLPFPVHFYIDNFLLVFGTVIAMGTLVSYIFSRKVILEK